MEDIKRNTMNVKETHDDNNETGQSNKLTVIP